MYQHVVSVNAQVIAARADGTRQLDKLLKQPAAAVAAVGELDVEFLGSIAEDIVLVDELQVVSRTEVHYLLLFWSHYVYLLDGVANAVLYAFKAQRQNIQVFRNDGNHHVDRFV